jgi:hypothetical protein
MVRALSGPFLAVIDLIGLRPRSGTQRAATAWLNWRAAVLPAAAALVFLSLLSAANPLIATLVNGLSIGGFFDFYPGLSLLAALMFYLALRPLALTDPIPRMPDLDVDGAAPAWHSVYFAPGPVIATLVLLNGIFALQNGLDLHYLWSGAALPPGFTHAEYVHRGADALILAALAAGALTIAALWPGSRSEASAPVRGLVYLWIGQTLLLVVSSVARTLAYVDAYGMTEMRLTGLIWMGLVALGLGLIGFRILTSRSNLWLLNANLAAAFALIFALGFFDNRAAVAEFNVSRALDPVHAGEYFDLAYLDGLGVSALPALRRHAGALAPRSDGREISRQGEVAAVIASLERRRAMQQAHWRRWTLRAALIGGGEGP